MEGPLHITGFSCTGPDSKSRKPYIDFVSAFSNRKPRPAAPKGADGEAITPTASPDEVQLVVVGIVGRSGGTKAALLKQLSGHQTVDLPELGLYAYLDREQRRVYLLCNSTSDWRSLVSGATPEGKKTDNLSSWLEERELDDIRNLSYVFSISHIVLHSTGAPRIDTRFVAQLRAAHKLRSSMHEGVQQSLGDNAKSKDAQSLKPGKAVPQLVVLLRCESGSAELAKVSVQLSTVFVKGQLGAIELTKKAAKLAKGADYPLFSYDQNCLCVPESMSEGFDPVWALAAVLNLKAPPTPAGFVEIVDSLCAEQLSSGTTPFEQWTKKGPKHGLPSLRQFTLALARLAQLYWQKSEIGSPSSSISKSCSTGVPKNDPDGATSSRGDTTVYVGKIPHKLSDTFLLQLLQHCGQVVAWRRVMDPATQRSKPFGFVQFESADGVLRALRVLNGALIEGSKILVIQLTLLMHSTHPPQARCS